MFPGLALQSIRTDPAQHLETAYTESTVKIIYMIYVDHDLFKVSTVYNRTHSFGDNYSELARENFSSSEKDNATQG